MSEALERIRSAVMIGPGEVGTRLADGLTAAGWRVDMVTRETGWERATDPGDPSPRIVAVREEDLASVLDRFQGPERGWLVLVQNGFLEAVHGDLSMTTRGLIWFMSKKEVFHELTESVFYGPLAGPLAAALSRGGLRVATIDDGERATFAMIVKGIWNCVVGLPLAVHGVDLDRYLSEHAAELAALVDESVRCAAAEYRVAVPVETVLETIRETTRPIRFVRGGTKALAWRNGAIAGYGRRHGIPTPVNDRLLAAAGFEAR